MPVYANVAVGDVADMWSRGSSGYEDDDFWIAYLESGYQYDEQRDKDPDPETATGGVTANFQSGVGGDGATIWLETIRDRLADGAVAGLEARIIPHEVGHQFGLGHSSGIMSPDLTNGPLGDDFRFTDNDLDALRDHVESPEGPS